MVKKPKDVILKISIEMKKKKITKIFLQCHEICFTLKKYYF